MTELYNPKKEVYTALKTLGYTCVQGNQAIFNKTPAITFNIGDNVPTYDLEKDIAKFDVEMNVDVWADDSVTASRVAKEVESAMRGIDYLMNYLADIPRPEGALYHIAMRFDAIK